MKKVTNAIYCSDLNVIGGIETYLYELAKKYGDYDIQLFYNTADKNQLRRLKKYIKCNKLDHKEKIQCKQLFILYHTPTPDFEADKIILILHATYSKASAGTYNELTNEIYGCSKAVAEDYEKLYNRKAGVCYNPISIDKPQRVLKLISATRLTKEKGKNRMIELGKQLDAAEIPYIWLVFTNDRYGINNPNIVYMQPRLDIRNYIAEADYLVQLSDTEGYCYSVLEALCLGTPVIVTPIPCLIEMGVENGKNGYIIDFDMSNIPIKEIYNNIPKFEYTPFEDGYDKLIIKEKSKYKEELKMKFRVKALPTFTMPDNERGKTPEVGEEWIVTKERLDVLLGDNSYHKALVEVVEELKEVEPKKEIKKAVKKTKKSQK